ncbi:MAG: PIN domain-containing protein [Oscillatoriaceae cyanobacterium]
MKSNNYIKQLFQKYRNKGILIDTNILLLWCVGSTNRDRISKFNRTETFIPEDYDTLLKVLQCFSQIVTTPNILTEVNSLVNQIGEPDRTRCLVTLAEGITMLKEFYLPSENVVKVDKYIKFGLTDSGIIELSRDKYLVLTDDLRLATYLQSLGIDTVNFNHIRVYGW